MDEDLDQHGTTADAGSSLPSAPKRPRGRLGSSFLTAAPALAIAALTAAPMAAAIRIGAGVGAPQATGILAQDCKLSLVTGALSTLKWPDCTGD
jgi:hypothetical protein